MNTSQGDKQKKVVHHIIFDKSARKWVVETMSYHIKNTECQNCKIKIKATNIGGYNDKGAFCSNLICIISCVKSL